MATSDFKEIIIKDYFYQSSALPDPPPSPAAERLNTDVQFTDDALKTIVKVPRPFLKPVLQGCVKWADENGVKVLTEKEMKIIADKRSAEKKKNNRGFA